MVKEVGPLGPRPKWVRNGMVEHEGDLDAILRVKVQIWGWTFELKYDPRPHFGLKRLACIGNYVGFSCGWGDLQERA